MLGCFPVSLGGTSIKQRIKCLAQGHNTMPRVSLKLATPSILFVLSQVNSYGHGGKVGSPNHFFQGKIEQAVTGLEIFFWTYSSCGASGLNFSLVLTPVELVLKSGILKETKHIIQ